MMGHVHPEERRTHTGHPHTGISVLAHVCAHGYRGACTHHTCVHRRTCPHHTCAHIGTCVYVLTTGTHGCVCTHRTRAHAGMHPTPHTRMLTHA